MRTLLSILLLLFFIQPIFAQQGPPVDIPEIPQAPVSIDGGRIDLSTIPALEELGLADLFIEIPQGGVTDQINIQVGVPTSIPLEKVAAQAVEFIVEGHEEGFTFEKPVTIGIPYPETVENETALTVMQWDPTSETWNPIELVESIVVDEAANVISALVTHFSTYGAVENPSPQVVSIEITPTETNVMVGEDVQFEATAYDSENNAVEATITWSVEGDIGEITEEGEFTATTAGTGTVTAAVNEISASAEVTVTESEEAGGEPVITSIEVFPSEATVAVGETVQFEVEAEDSEGEEVEVQNVEWSLDNPDVGSIDGTGLFTASAEGETQITATVDELTATADVVVLTEIVLPEGVNTISLQRQHPDGKITPFGSTITEGNSITLGGIPFPFNYLNGGDLYFPENSLDDDIVITIKLPSFANVNEQKKEVGFDIDAEVLSVVTFEVSVDGEPIHPFPFNPNLVLTLPYKRGLLNNLGIEPENLTFFYVDESGELVEEGIGNVEVDLEANTITGNIAHFSDIAIASKDNPTIPVELPSAPVNADGGRIDLSTIPKLVELGLEDLFIEIPKGGVAEQINIQVTVPTAIPVEKAATKAVEFIVEGHEEGFTFEKPVTIGIPYPESVENETALTVMQWDPTRPLRRGIQ